MSFRPTGTVTFLFTDIEGSTRLWQQFPDAMAAVLARHHELLRHSIESHRGYVFQIVGDAFCAAFETAIDAVSAGLAAQAGLTEENWGTVGRVRVRMALHTGTAQLKPGDYTAGEYASGLTLSRTSRLLSAAHGGQLLLSSVTAELIRDQLPADVRLIDLGVHRLKDLAQPQHIFQICPTALARDIPAPRTLDTLPNNLPIQHTSFVGREQEVVHIVDQLQRVSLMTLTGAGGSGKTRLSIQAAARLIDDFEDGVWFIELAPISDPTFIPSTIGETLGLKMISGRSVQEVLLDYLRSKRALLVLDNCEHLIGEVARLAHAILHACPHVKLLASSRESLHIPGETLVPVRPLSVPDIGRNRNGRGIVERLSDCEAVRLFIDRAVAVQSTFVLGADNAADVAEICVRLDGIPLAIELAAARARVLSANQILKRLKDCFQLLTGGSRTALPRQQTLRAAIDWSHDLLSEPERALLRRLSVFAGGCTLAAAESVAAGTDIEAFEVLDLLSNLVDKSLVITREVGGEVRYLLLETVRQYSGRKLSNAGEQDKHRDLHLAFFLALARSAELHLRGHGQVLWLNRLAQDNDNLRTAIDWAAASGQTQAALKFAGLLGWFWHIRGNYSDGRYWLDRVCRLSGADRFPTEYAQALYFDGLLAFFGSDPATTERLLADSLAVARSHNNRAGVAYAMDFMAVLAVTHQRFDEAQPLFDESLGLFRDLDDRWGIAFSLWHQGQSSDIRSDRSGALTHWRCALSLIQAIGDKFRESVLSRNVGRYLALGGDIEGAIALIKLALRLSDELGARYEIANNMWVFGECILIDGDSRSANRLLISAATLYDEIGVLHSAAATIQEGERMTRWRQVNAEIVAAAEADKTTGSLAASIQFALNYQVRSAAAYEGPIQGRGDL